MRDTNRIQKLLNLTSSSNDAEALAALRMAQKLLIDGDSLNLGDFLAGTSGLKKMVSEDLYNELSDLFEKEVEKNESLRKSIADKEKSVRKYQRDIQNLKRELDRAEERYLKAEREIDTLSERLLTGQ